MAQLCIFLEVNFPLISDFHGVCYHRQVREFPFVEHPGEERLNKALETLYCIGALESMDSTKLTERGIQMAELDQVGTICHTVLANLEKLKSVIP